MRILNRHFMDNLKAINLKIPASTSGRIIIAFVVLAILIAISYYLSGFTFIVFIILLGAFIYNNTENRDTDYKCTDDNDDDQPKGDGYRDGPEGYGYYSGGVRDDE